MIHSFACLPFSSSSEKSSTLLARDGVHGLTGSGFLIGGGSSSGAGVGQQQQQVLAAHQHKDEYGQMGNERAYGKVARVWPIDGIEPNHSAIRAPAGPEKKQPGRKERKVAGHDGGCWDNGRPYACRHEMGIIA